MHQDDELQRLLDRLTEATAAADQARRQETAARRAVVAEGLRTGMSLRQIAKAMGISHQRVAQIQGDLEAETRRS